MFPVRFKGTKNMCLPKNKGYKLLKVSLTKGTVYSTNYKLCTTNYNSIPIWNIEREKWPKYI